MESTASRAMTGCHRCYTSDCVINKEGARTPQLLSYLFVGSRPLERCATSWCFDDLASLARLDVSGVAPATWVDIRLSRNARAHGVDKLLNEKASRTVVSISPQSL